MGAQWKQKGREANANAKGKVMGKLAKEIMVAARDGADPSMNARLRMAVEAARKVSMTKDTIERAIKKGSGQLDGAIVFETVTYEGFTPHMVPVIVECLTDNRNRTSSNIKVLFRKGQLATSGAISWDFDRLGAIEATPPAAGTDADEAAIEAGAQDLEATATTADDLLHRARRARPGQQSARRAQMDGHFAAKLIWKAKNPVAVDDEAKRGEVEAFLSAIDEDDDVQTLFVGIA
jgi:YebC/PmpR family DNA-binding regulatory protein